MIITAGATSQSIPVFIQDSSLSTGAGLTGLLYNTANLIAYYRRQGQSSMTAITLADMTLGTWTSGGFKVTDGTHAPGEYELGLPDAAIASSAGVNWVEVRLQGATNMCQTTIMIQLTKSDLQDSVRLGLTGLANAVPGASGGLLIAGTNAPVTITGSGDALTLTSTGGNGKGLKATGNGTGDGITATSGSGATGNGITAVSGATNGAGLQATGAGSGNGLGLTAGASGSSSSGVVTTYAIKKNSGLSPLVWQMVLSSDHVTPATGKTVSCQRSIDGGAYAACNTATATEISNGSYKVNLAASDLNGNMISFLFTATGCDQTVIGIVTQAA